LGSGAAKSAAPRCFSLFLCRLRFCGPNRELFSSVERIKKNGGFMSFLNRLLGKSEPPKQRVQVCVECGMPVADHKQWCSILQGQNEMKQKTAEKNSA
jgi:hypothetical protein